MTTVHNYLFNNLSRIGMDGCSISQRENLNKAHGNYILNNHYLGSCGMEQPINFALKQPSMFYKGGYGSNVGLGGCVVDTNSKMTIGTIRTRSKCKIGLNPRPFLTVPYLGRGRLKPVLEFKLIQGDHVYNKKTKNHLSETPFLRENVPMISSLRQNIQNPAHLIESDASSGWVRGGVPSRDLVRGISHLYN